MKHVSIIGIGKLGLCLALNMERKGYRITGVDVSEAYVRAVNEKTLQSDEANVTAMLQQSSLLTATTDLVRALESDILFVMVATPSLPDGTYDHTQVESVASQLMALGRQDRRKDFIIGCTTMPGYSQTLAEKLEPFNYKVSYNPEFIAQGTIIKDQQYPDMVLIGEADEKAGDILESITRDVVENEPRYCRMTPTEAEITKIALNCFLTTKIAYANMVGDVAEASGCRHEKILGAIGEDSRIGKKYLRYGFGFGGPCFPRDNRAFGVHAERVGVYPHISYATDKSNAHHLELQSKSMAAKVNGSVKFDHVTYKPESTMIEQSQQLLLASRLADAGIAVTIHERPVVIDQVRKIYGDKFIYEVRS